MISIALFQNPLIYALHISSARTLKVKKFWNKLLLVLRYYLKIRNRRNDLLFENDYFIIVHKKTILMTADMKTIFDKIWYIVEYLIMNLFSFVIFFIDRNPRRE